MLPRRLHHTAVHPPPRSVRKLNWHVDMVAMLALLLLVLPYYHSYVALSAKLRPVQAAAGGALALAAFTFAFWRLGHGALPAATSAGGTPPPLSMVEAVGRVGVIGIVLVRARRRCCHLRLLRTRRCRLVSTRRPAVSLCPAKHPPPPL